MSKNFCFLKKHCFVKLFLRVLRMFNLQHYVTNRVIETSRLK